jgi:hypothetical protein
VQVERERGVVKLRTHPVGAAKGAGQLHLADGFGGEDFAGLVMLGEGLEQLFVAEKLFQHLRWDFDEVALRRKAGESGPLRLAAENGVHQVAEFVEEGDDVVVLQQARIVFVALREVADQRGLRQRAPANAGDDGRGGEPLVLAIARVHVEIETAHALPPSKTSKTETSGARPRHPTGGTRL